MNIIDYLIVHQQSIRIQQADPSKIHQIHQTSIKNPHFSQRVLRGMSSVPCGPRLVAFLREHRAAGRQAENPGVWLVNDDYLWIPTWSRLVNHDKSWWIHGDLWCEYQVWATCLVPSDPFGGVLKMGYTSPSWVSPLKMINCRDDNLESPNLGNPQFGKRFRKVDSW